MDGRPLLQASGIKGGGLLGRVEMDVDGGIGRALVGETQTMDREASNIRNTSVERLQGVCGRQRDGGGRGDIGEFLAC